MTRTARRTLAVALTAAIAAGGGPALAAECAGRITVQGEGVVTVVPDLLRLTFHAQADAVDPPAALREASTRTAAMLAALSGAGIAEGDLATVEVSLSPVYEDYRANRPEGGPRIVGWRAGSGVVATIRDLSSFGAVLEQATAAGATGLAGLAFDASDRAARMTEARAAAVKDALARAAGMAEAAGLELGPVTEISEHRISAPRMFEARAMAMSDASTMPIAPGDRELTATVGLTAQLCP